MNARRQILGHLAATAALAAGLLGAGGATAQTAQTVDVVKVMNFGCSVCYAAEAIDRAIEREVVGRGGRFVRAPVPNDGETGNRERVYYAARDMDPQFGEAVKEVLYEGSQVTTVPLAEYLQLYTWLGNTLPKYAERIDALFQAAQDDKAGKALERAVRLALNAGVLRFPTYIVLVNNRVVSTHDPSTAGSLGKLRDEVLDQVRKYADSR